MDMTAVLSCVAEGGGGGSTTKVVAGGTSGLLRIGYRRMALGEWRLCLLQHSFRP